MKIYTQSESVTVPIGHNYTGERFTIEALDEISGYGTAVSWWPNTAMLVEWEWKSEWGKATRYREIVMVPSENDSHWIDDLVRARAKRGHAIVGIIPVAQIGLLPYEVPEEYRKEIAREEAYLSRDTE